MSIIADMKRAEAQANDLADAARIKAQQCGEDTQERESQADQAINLVLSEDIQLFHDQHNTPYACITISNAYATDAFNSTSETKRRGTHREIIRLHATTFKTYVAHLIYENDNKVIGQEAINSALNVLHFKALQREQHILYNRVAPDPSGDGSIWIDTADNSRRAYHVTKDGWTLECDVPILFRSYEHQQALPEAVAGGDPWQLLEYMNLGKTHLLVSDNPLNASVASKYKQKQLLFMVHCASYFIPDIPHPINMMYGCKGTWKSTSQTFIRGIFDPSSVPLLGFPRDENALTQQLEHHWMPIYDNISTTPKWFNDALCRAVTGTGQETRALYTDDDVIIRNFKRCIMLNGINLPAEKGDLLDRTILYETIPDADARKTEKELKAAYEQARPAILGGFLDTLSKALKIKETVKPTKFRLADFSCWGCALSEALGHQQTEFIEASEDNLRSQNEEAAHASPVASAFVAYCSKNLEEHDINNPYIDTPTNIFHEVEATAQIMLISTKTNGWPRGPQPFTRKLSEVRDAIAAFGWCYEVIANGAKRDMHIWSTAKAKPKPIPEAIENKETKKRYCRDECINANPNDCIKGTYCYTGEVPLDCTRYDYKGAFE
jgi:hypothetical protein